MKRSSTSQSPNRIAAALVTVFWLAIWQLLYVIVGREIFLPSPIRVAARLLELCGSFAFWKIITSSYLRIVAGFLLALLAGACMGILSVRFPVVYQLFRPLLRMISTTPIASFIILAMLLVTSRLIPSVITFLMVLPLVWNNFYQGMLQIDRELREMLQVFCVPSRKRWWALTLPSLMPYFSAAVTTGIGFAWKAGVAAEVIAMTSQSIGKQIYDSKVYLETVDLFAWTVAVITLSFVLEKISFGCLSLLKGYASHKKEVLL